MAFGLLLNLKMRICIFSKDILNTIWRFAFRRNRFHSSSFSYPKNTRRKAWLTNAIIDFRQVRYFWCSNSNWAICLQSAVWYCMSSSRCTRWHIFPSESSEWIINEPMQMSEQLVHSFFCSLISCLFIVFGRKSIIVCSKTPRTQSRHVRGRDLDALFAPCV